ncbi:hypothetical protein CsatB_008012 [Cannabis sativa]|uniref:SMP domain-containing protein n=2 Tax=Cannabis sativa TaxID=3483 RepID=A0A7J6GZV5_CANSA|nr:hypothetical protein G4B88_023885 [Cannabis sativa]KAF4388504.1 hypothetical protein F8388_012481 [Cannabis sativa]
MSEEMQIDQEPIKENQVGEKPITSQEASPESTVLGLAQKNGEASTAQKKTNHYVCMFGHSTITTSDDDQLSDQSAITIGEALETTAKVIGLKTLRKSDAAAIQAAEARATGSSTDTIKPGGLAEMAKSMENFSSGLDVDDKYKYKLRDVLTGAIGNMVADKVATREDAEAIANAEMRNDPNMMIEPGGVAAAVKAAAAINEKKSTAHM